MPQDNQKELFVVVDKDDNILGYKTRYECHHDKSLIHRSVGVVIFNNSGKILLQKRSMSKDTYPGFYGLSASGHANKGETPEETMQREAMEEIGVQLDLEFKVKYVYRDFQETEMDYLFTAIHNGPFPIDPTKVEKVDFFSLEELKSIKDEISPYSLLSLQKLGLIF